MKDYSINSFERKSFILYYDIDSLKQEITIYYADRTKRVFPYNLTGEKILLENMKNQVISHKKDYNTAKKELKEYNFYNKITLIILAIGLGISLSSFQFGIFEGIQSLIFNAFISRIIFKIGNFKNVRTKLNNFTQDYEKNLYFLNNENDFSNKKIITPNVLRNASDKITHIINNGIITDEYADYQELSNDTDEVYVDHIITEDEEDIKELTMKGFKDYSQREIPFININTAGMLSQSELDNLKKQINQNDKPKAKVLSKINK